MSYQHMNPEEVGERLQSYFRAEEREMKLPPEIWERLSPRLGEQKRARRLLHLPLDGIVLARRGKRYGVLASILGVIILAGVLFLPRPWSNTSQTPATAFAAAFDDLLAVESVHVVVDEYRSRVFWLLWAEDETDISGITIQVDDLGSTGFPLPIATGEWIEEECMQEGTFRECVVKEAATGRTVGHSQATGGRMIWEALLTPDRQSGCGTLLPDDDWDGPIREGIRESKFSFAFPESILFRSVPSSPWRFWGLFDQPVEDVALLPSLLDGFDSVERLDDTDLDGVRVEHYRAERAFDEGGSEVVALWLGKEDRLARKLTREGDWGPNRPGTYSWDSTYTFSDFNGPITESLMNLRHSSGGGVTCSASSSQASTGP